MAVEGIEYLYFETRDWVKASAFWRSLGFTLGMEVGNAGRFDPPGGGPGVFVQQVGRETPLAHGVYLKTADPDFRPGPPAQIIGDPVATHWETQLVTVRDPDGREFMIQSSPS